MNRCVLALLLALCDSFAVADGGQTAAEYHGAGTAAYRAGDFTAAVSAFTEAYRLERNPETLFSLAQAYRQVYIGNHEPGVLLKTVELYRQYLAEVPRGGRSRDTRELLSNLDPLATLIKDRQPTLQSTSLVATTQLMVWSRVDGASARIDQEPPVALPLVRDVSPGVHDLRITADGYQPLTLTVKAIENRLVPVEAVLLQLPSRLTITNVFGADLVLDGVQRKVMRESMVMPAGAHRIWVGMRGRLGVEQTVVLAPGEERRLSFDLLVSPRRRAARWMLVGSAVLAGSAIIAGGYAYYETDRATTLLDIRAERPWTVDELNTYNDARSSASSWKGASIALVATSAVASAIVAWLWFDDSPRPP